MFFKFAAHDLRYGVFHQRGRLLVTFLMFFCLSSYHFLTLRIFELSNPEYFRSPPTTADYLLAVIGGCGRPETLPGGDSNFTLPVLWGVFVLWVLFTSLYYPFVDLNGIGKQMMPLSGSRGIWWASKCVWAAVNTVVVYLIICLACFLSGLCFGAVPSGSANWYLSRELNMQTNLLTTDSTWDMGPAFLLTALTLMALSLLQLTLSLMLKPLFSYLLVAGYLFAGAYVQSPAFFGNYAMAARSSLLISTGLEPGLAVLLALWIAALSVIVGYVTIQRKDILGGD